MKFSVFFAFLSLSFCFECANGGFNSTLGSGPCGLVWPCCSSYPCASSAPDDRIIKFCMMVTLSGIQADDDRVDRRSLEMAIDDINAIKFLPRGYVLVGNYADDQGTSDGAMISTIRCMLQDLEHVKVPLFVGPLYSASAKIASILAKDWWVPVLSPAASAPTLSNKQLYPTFSRSLPTDAAVGVAYAALCVKMQWFHVAVINSNDEFGVNLVAQFRNASVPLGIETLTSVTFSAQAIPFQLNEIKRAGARIILLATQVNDLATTWQAAVKLGMTGAPYVWINPDSDSALLDPTRNGGIDFTGLLSIHPYVNISSPQYLNFTAKWSAQYRQDARLAYNSTGPDSYSPFAYDSVWAGAHAIKVMLEQQWNFSSSNETYKYLLRAELLRQIRAISFTGLTGLFSLDDKGDRENIPFAFFNAKPDATTGQLSWVEVGLYQQGSSSAVGGTSSPSLSFDWQSVLWPGNLRGVKPRDQPLVQLTFLTVSPALLKYDIARG